jgi:hypothetical protein
LLASIDAKEEALRCRDLFDVVLTPGADIFSPPPP